MNIHKKLNSILFLELIILCSSFVYLDGKIKMFDVTTINEQAKKILHYDPSIDLINKKDYTQQITITCHGYGANKEIGFMVAPLINTPVLTFNFPDHDLIHTLFFGTIHEYLPLIFLLKECIASGVQKINLYGFSAGGGAIINTLAILNSNTYEAELARIGVHKKETQDIVGAIEAGTIILDAPLKSVEEILSIRPYDPVIQKLAQRFKTNGFEPIEVIEQLTGLKLNIFIYFEQPDQILSNRDDQLFYEKLKDSNKEGKTQLIIGTDGGHNRFHKKLWQALKSFKI